MIGKQIHHYKILEKLGSGGMGEVYLAEDTRLKRRVALKLLAPAYSNDPEFGARFRHEAQAAAALDHPNIVTVYELGEHENQLFITMQYVPGQTLQELIESGKLTLKQSLEIAGQVCKGLSEAHQAGIVHRDIKPANIICTNDGVAKILDFGLAKISGATKLTREGSTLGTAQYQSPEQCRGEEADQRSDLFSLGVVLYEMITGKLPFTGDYEESVRYAISHEEAQPLSRFASGITDNIQRIVSKLLEKDPALRYQSAAGVISDLKPLGLLKSSSVSAATRNNRARKLRWAGTIAVVGLVVMWAGLQYSDYFDPPETPTKSLAVVDFDNIGSEEDAYLASGLAEDLAVKLRRLDGFQVASSADIRRLAKENLLPREIAARLKVQYALGGSLLRNDTIVRVNVELIDKESGDVVWSDQIDKHFTEIFQFMDEVSLKIAHALEVRLTQVEEATLATKPTDNTEAYDHYLKGRYFYYNVTFRYNDFAEREFEKALQLDPDYPLALAGLADTYVQRYKERFDYDETWLDTSKVLIDRALTLDPVLAEAYESRAELFIEEDNITGAIEAAEKARDLRPEWDEPYVHLGNIFSERGERSRALAMFDTALSLRPSVDALIGKGDIFQTRGYMDSARATYEAALELNPYHDLPYLALGWLHEELYEGEETERLSRRAIEVRPDHVFGYSRVSTRLFYRGSVEEGEELLRGFVKRFPYNWDGYRALYNYLKYKRDDVAAFQIIEEAVKRNPERVWPQLLLAYSYAQGMSPVSESGEIIPQSDRAVTAVERALSLRPNSGRVLEWAGMVFASLNRLDEAEVYFDRALESRPGSNDLLTNIGGAFFDAEEYEKSLAYVRSAVKQSPGEWLNYFYLGQVLIQLDKRHEYLYILQEAAREYGDDPRFLITLCREQRLAGQFDAAVQSCQRALAVKRTSFWGGLVPLGIALWLSGNAEGALDIIREEKESFQSGHWIVDILKSEGRFREIEQYLESIKEKTPLRMSGIDYWSDVASDYYFSMRRFDDVLSVLREERESGEETDSPGNTMTVARCYEQKGMHDSAKYVLEELADKSTGAALPDVLIAQSRLLAIDARDFAAALKLAERASTEQVPPQSSVIEPLLRLQYASRLADDVAKTLEQIRSMSWPRSSHGLYRKAQIAIATSFDNAKVYLDHAISNLTLLSRGFVGWGNIGEPSAFLSLALARAGKPTEAAREIERALRLEPERYDIAYHAACAYSLMGDNALALQWLETAVERGHLELWWARVDPDLDPLRELPRFKEIMTNWDSRIQALLKKSD